jgi:hypothetical protein
MDARQVLAGRQRVDAGRRHQDAGFRQAHTVQHPVQQMGGRAPHLVRALHHGTERYARERAHQRVVVDANQGYLFRHFDAGQATGLQQLARARVRDGDDAYRFRQAAQPRDLALHRLVPR